MMIKESLKDIAHKLGGLEMVLSAFCIKTAVLRF